MQTMDIKVVREPVSFIPAHPQVRRGQVEVIKGLNKSFTEF